MGLHACSMSDIRNGYYSPIKSKSSKQCETVFMLLIKKFLIQYFYWDFLKHIFTAEDRGFELCDFKIIRVYILDFYLFLKFFTSKNMLKLLYVSSTFSHASRLIFLKVEYKFKSI